MSNILIVTSSVSGDQSISGRIVAGLVDRVRAERPDAQIVIRDIGSRPLPHLVPETVAAIRGEPQTPAEREARALSDSLVAELKAADLIVIASPMYNFGISSTLKAWFDHVLRARVTFRYTEAGPEGLLAGRKAIVVETRAGHYSEGPAAAMDGQEPHLRTMLGFMGLGDATFIRAEKLAFGPDAVEAAVAQAITELDAVLREDLPLAA